MDINLRLFFQSPSSPDCTIKERYEFFPSLPCFAERAIRETTKPHSPHPRHRMRALQGFPARGSCSRLASRLASLRLIIPKFASTHTRTPLVQSIVARILKDRTHPLRCLVIVESFSPFICICYLIVSISPFICVCHLIVHFLWTQPTSTR